jgi:uncharacterized protein
MNIARLVCFVLLCTCAIQDPILLAEDVSPPARNRLAQESSPYLLLHAHNPVDWYPWGPEAFEKAKQDGKPIFLSIGYSSCYWCHVMERKVFSDAAIAKYMNEHFVNIKVDREERPDVDDIYMTSLIVYQQLAGSSAGGGWPLSMFLTPDGNPIGGATYLPPVDSPERGPGFLSVSQRVTEMWRDRKDDLNESAAVIASHVQRMARPALALEVVTVDASLLDAAIAQVKEMYDPVWGGVDFNQGKPNSPRFPNVPRLEFALDRYEANGDVELLKIVEHSLSQMAKGGLQDHLAGGFHRYSTDRRWHVPHFEKMLYDQAQLLGIYARAAEITGKTEYRDVAAGIADFVQRELTTQDGAFCSALDAETNAVEGEYYVWSRQELLKILGEADAALFADVYGFDRENPFEHGFVVHLAETIPESAARLKIDATELANRLAQMRQTLLQVRSKRERPLLDDKVLTAWNAQMIQSLAYSGRVLKRSQDINAAVVAADFLLANLRNADGTLLRTWRNGTGKYPGYLDDYAFLVAAAIELHRSTGEERWRETAAALAEKQHELFYDTTLNAYYFTAHDHEKLIARTSSVYDSVFPSANSVSICNLLRLGALKSPVGPVGPVDQVPNILNRFAATLKKSPASCAGLGRAAHMWLEDSKKNEQAQSRSSVSSQYRLTAWQIPAADNKVTTDVPVAATDAEPQQHSTFRPIQSAVPASRFVQKEKEKPLKVNIYPMYSKLPMKGKSLIAIELVVQPGWHINANPSSPDFLVPTTVELKSKQKVKLTKVKYPEHHPLKVQGSDEPYHVYDGNAIVYALLETDETETTEFIEMQFHVRFQGCNSTQCLPPDMVPMGGKLPLAKAGEPLVKIEKHVSKFPKPKKANDAEDDGEKAEKLDTAVE